MPLYEYGCPSCGTFEVIQKFSDPLLTICPKCESAVEKLLSAPAFHLKGTGWYITDYARKGQKSEGGGSEAKTDSKADSKAEAKAESKGDTKADSKAESKPAASSTPATTTT